jgi:hypothetical protein
MTLPETRNIICLPLILLLLPLLLLARSIQ